jgi:hypothetical protein
MNLENITDTDLLYNELMELQSREPSWMDRKCPPVWKYQECPWRAVNVEGNLEYFEGEPKIDFGGYLKSDKWVYNGERSNKREKTNINHSEVISWWHDLKECRN